MQVLCTTLNTYRLQTMAWKTCRDFYEDVYEVFQRKEVTSVNTLDLGDAWTRRPCNHARHGTGWMFEHHIVLSSIISLSSKYRVMTGGFMFVNSIRCVMRSPKFLHLVSACIRNMAISVVTSPCILMSFLHRKRWRPLCNHLVHPFVTRQSCLMFSTVIS